jgi:hypothetical protein
MIQVVVVALELEAPQYNRLEQWFLSPSLTRRDRFYTLEGC